MADRLPALPHRHRFGSSVWLLLLVVGPTVTSFAPAVDRSTRGVIETKATTTTTEPLAIEAPTEACQSQPARYDLGIGKNPPVGVDPYTVHIWDALDASLAVRYLEEYIGVVEYPSPRAIQHHKESATAKLPQARYDLGIGKNPPLHSLVGTSFDEPDSKTAVQFLEEYESVVEYPSPLQHPHPRSAGSSKKKRQFPVHVHRFSVDLIDICEVASGGSGARPVAYTHRPSPGTSQRGSGGRRSPWDLNTPWVEMLIHEQQQQLLVAAH